MNKRFLAFMAVLFLGIFSLYAVPAQRSFKTYQQPDGSTITLSLQGDEFGHWYVTPDNRIHKKLGNGQFVPCSPVEIADLKQQRQEAIRRVWDGDSEIQKSSPRRAGQSRHPKGDQRVLVILAEYQDLSFTLDNPKEAFKTHLNAENYKGAGGYGSARDYFIDQSDGQFSPYFDVYGPYKASRNMSYYGGSDGDRHDANAAELIAEVAELADKDVDYKDYDSDGDGMVDFCYVIYAGYGEAHGADENTIWPHAWNLMSGTGSALKLDGVKINSYACSCELTGNSGKTIDGIGTICHEFSHTLGLPDFYDTEDGGHFGMSTWSLMDNGCYNENGFTPCGYTAYEKEYMGWIDIETLDKEQSVTLTPTAKGGKAYRIENSENTNEYYIVENIQQEGWNRGAYGHGMVVMHVDYDSPAWNSNTVNNYTPERMTIVPADNIRASSVKSLAGDPYPGNTGNTELTDTSTPAAETNSGSCFSQPITDITEADGVVKFNFMKGCGEATSAIAATNVTSCSFNAKWNKRIGTDDYTLEVFHITGDIPEDQTKWNNSLLNTSGELIMTVHTRSTEYTVTNLEANSLYCYRARCLKNGSLSTFSNIVYVLTKEDKGTLAAPTLNKPVKNDSTVTLSWNAVDKASGYILEYEYLEKKPIIPDGRELVSESFLRVKESSGDITRVLDLYTDTTDWRGSEVHGQNGRILLGSEKEVGYIVSPVLPQTSGMVTVYFSVSKYSKSDESPLIFICIATDEDEKYYIQQLYAPITETSTTPYYAVLGPLSTGSQIYFITQSLEGSSDTPRICLDDIAILWGDYSEQETGIASRQPLLSNPQCQLKKIEDSGLRPFTPTTARPSYVATSTKKYVQTEDTQITLEGLQEGEYTFRVRSLNDKTYSPFSDMQTTRIGSDFFFVDGMNFELVSEEKKTVEMKSLEDGALYEGDLIVPETIQVEGETFAVTSLADSLFRGCSKLTSVTVPATITYTGSTLFKGCNELAYVDWKSNCALDSASFVGVSYNTLVFVSGTTEVASDNVNVVRDGQIDSLIVNLNGPFLTPYDIQVGHVNYAKDFSQETILGTTAGWETLVVPFDVQSITHEEAGKLTPFGVEGSDKHFWLGAYNGNTFEKAQQVKANVPYIISFPNSTDYKEADRMKGTMTFSADNTIVHATTNVPAVTGSSFDFVPVYKKVYKSGSHYMLNTYDHSSTDKPCGSTFLPNSMSLRTFGAYMRPHGQANAPRFIPIRFDDEVEAPVTEAPSDIYGVDGRLVKRHAMADEDVLKELEPGIYVMEGKKVIIK